MAKVLPQTMFFSHDERSIFFFRFLNIFEEERKYFWIFFKRGKEIIFGFFENERKKMFLDFFWKKRLKENMWTLGMNELIKTDYRNIELDTHMSRINHN